MQVRTVHVAILFGTVYVCRIIWRHLLPAHAVVLVVLSGVLYIAKLRQSKSPLDAALETLMKEEQALTHATNGNRTDDNTTGQYNITRQTHFMVSESERGIFLPRHRKYSSMLSGTREQRQKFKKSMEKRVHILDEVCGAVPVKTAEVIHEKEEEDAIDEKTLMLSTEKATDRSRTKAKQRPGARTFVES